MALAAFFVVVSPLAQRDDPGATPLDAFAYVLLVSAGLSFGARGRHPYAGYAVALACTVGYLLGGYGGGPIYVAPFVGLVRVVAVSEPRVWAPIAGAVATALALATALEDGWSWSIALSTGVWLVGALLVGEELATHLVDKSVLARYETRSEVSYSRQALAMTAGSSRSSRSGVASRSASLLPATSSSAASTVSVSVFVPSALRTASSFAKSSS